MLPKIYNSRMDVDPEYVPKFVDWYKSPHGPDVVGAGFYSANGYQAVVGSPWICNFYEISGVDIFGPRYDAARNADDELGIIVAEKISNHSLMIYDQAFTEGIPASVFDDPDQPSIASAIIGSAVTTVRFDGIDRKAVLDWYHHSEFPRLRGENSFFRGRVCFEEGKHPVYPGNEPDVAIILEWGNVADARAQGGADDVLGRHSTALGNLDRASYHVVKHEYSLRHPDKWVP